MKTNVLEKKYSINQTVIFHYWRRVLKKKGLLRGNESIVDTAKALSEYYQEPNTFSKKQGYEYMFKKYIKAMSKRDTLQKESIDGCVYFIGSKKYKWVKIGYTTDLHKRLLALQSVSPCELNLLGYIPTNSPIKDEKKHHGMFSREKIHHEWFNLSDRMIEYINNCTRIVLP